MQGTAQRPPLMNEGRLTGPARAQSALRPMIRGVCMLVDCVSASIVTVPAYSLVTPANALGWMLLFGRM